MPGATGVLAMLALLAVRVRPLFWTLAVAFNVVGVVDLVVDYYHGAPLDLPAWSREPGAAYAIPILYVPLLTITHGAAFYLMARARFGIARRVGDEARRYASLAR